MRVLRLADRPVTPWKNGGGTTIEYAVYPEGAGLDDFAWRISRATVARDGPFSIFPSIDRTLSVLSGKGIALHFPERDVELDPLSQPYAFPADVAVEGRLIDGPIEDLNVMTQRGVWTQSVGRHTLGTALHLMLDANVSVIVAEAAADIRSPEDIVLQLADGDAVMVAGPVNLTVTSDATHAAVLVISLYGPVS